MRILDTVPISDSGAGSTGAAVMPRGSAARDRLSDGTRASAAGQSSEDRLAWLALALTPGLGPKRILDAVRQLESPSQIFTLPLTALEGLRFPAEAAQFLFDGKARRAAEEEWARVAAQGATLVSYSCPEYPERLREIYDPPPVLWVRGDVRLLSRPAIAIVGTRHPTPYGAGVAEMLARDLAARRLLIVSGMARGIDSCAHKGALAARMPTVAVWGTGIDVVYPKENRKLAEEILAIGRSDRERGAHGNVSGAAEFSAAESHFERIERGGSGGGGRRELGNARDRAMRRRAEPRPVCRAGQRDQQRLLDA